MIKYFRPQLDITARELAVILGNVLINPNPGQPQVLAMHQIFFMQEIWDNLHPLVRRHFADEPKTPLEWGEV